MKFVKILTSVFVLSILFVKTGASAWTYTVYTHALKSLGGSTEQAQLYKHIDDNQMLIINEVYKNRNIKFKISHSLGNNTWNDSTWQSVDIPEKYPLTLQLDGGVLQEYIVRYIGTKKLDMKTSGVHIGVTAIRGIWWISETEYQQYISSFNN